MKQKTVLVTGGAGYIGSKISYDLIDKKFKVIILDNLTTGYKFLVPKKVKFIRCNILNIKKIEKKLKKLKVDTIIHCAASLDVEESDKRLEKYYTNNVIGTESILRVAIKCKIKNFILSSTAAVYGDNKNISVKENTYLVPESNYGKTKLLSEMILKNYAKKYNINYAILRYFNVVGADKKLRCGPVKNKTLFKTLAKNIVRKQLSVNLYGNNYDTKDGTCIRDYIDINDLSDIHLILLKKIKKIKSIEMNCGYGKPLSVLDIINAFSKVSQKKIKIINKKKRPGDIEKIYCNITKQKKFLKHWRQKTTLEQSISNQISWEKKLFNKNAKYKN